MRHYYTGDPVMDAENFYSQDFGPAVYEHCDYCEHEIRSKYAYEINGLTICPDCLMEYLDGNCRVPVEVR